MATAERAGRRRGKEGVGTLSARAYKGRGAVCTSCTAIPTRACAARSHSHLGRHGGLLCARETLRGRGRCRGSGGGGGGVVGAGEATRVSAELGRGSHQPRAIHPGAAHALGVGAGRVWGGVGRAYEVLFYRAFPPTFPLKPSRPPFRQKFPAGDAAPGAVCAGAERMYALAALDGDLPSPEECGDGAWGSGRDCGGWMEQARERASAFLVDTLTCHISQNISISTHSFMVYRH